jgi:hypothetical protein
MIPSRFSILGQTIRVVFVEDLADTHEMAGRWRPTLNLIELQPPDQFYSEDYVNQTFWHEAIHAALDILGYEDLSKDEEFVDRMGQAVYQIIKTSEAL